MTKQNNAARRIDLPMQTRAAAIQPQTLDAEARTVEVVFSTGAPVRRVDWFEGRTYDELLSLEPAHVDLARLNAGAPVLDTHQQYSLEGVIGVVERAWIEGGEARAVLRIDRGAEVDPIWRKIEDGIVRNVSVGYQVRKMLVEKRDGEIERRRAVDWLPTEISFVPVGADAGAGTRAASSGVDLPTNPCLIVNDLSETKKETRDMPEDMTPLAPAAPAAPVDASAVRAEGARAERQRISDIETACRALGADDARRTAFVNEGRSADEVRRLLIDEAASRAAPQLDPIRTHTPAMPGGQDETETRHRLMANALEHRVNPQVKLEDGARQYRGLRLVEMARENLSAQGFKVRGLTPLEVSSMALNMERSGMHTTSDFPLILGGVVNRTLRDAYKMQPATYPLIARRINATDFKDIVRVQLGGVPELLPVGENGEFKRGSTGEAAERFKLATYGRVLSISRQVLVNDDLNAFGDLPRLYGARARLLENQIVWGLIVNNAKLSDGKALFHAAHGNLAAAGAPLGIDSISAGRKAMRRQKALDGRTRINVGPKFLCVGSALETRAEQFTWQQQFAATRPDDINVFANKLTALVEPELDDLGEYSFILAADPAMLAGIEFAYLEGEDGIFTETRMGFDVDGMEVKARLDFGAGAIDYRGFYMDPGAAPAA